MLTIFYYKKIGYWFIEKDLHSLFSFKTKDYGLNMNFEDHDHVVTYFHNK